MAEDHRPNKGGHEKGNPNFPLIHFTSEKYQNQFKASSRRYKALNWLGGLAILLSCLGLFGLSTFMASSVSKDRDPENIGSGISQIGSGFPGTS